jgi:hypothetical protein
LERGEDMALNRKLTPIIHGRKVESISQRSDVLSITFSDGSTLRVKTGGPVSAEALSGRAVRKVRQRGDIMNLDFAVGSSAEIKLSEATSSVMLRRPPCR